MLGEQRSVESVEDGTVSEPRHALEQVTSLITRHLGANLRGLYLFGSLPAGAFLPGRATSI